LIATSNKVFGRWGEVFGDDVVTAAMIDRLVHQAEVIALKATATCSRTATSAASQPQLQLTTKDQPQAGDHFSDASRGSVLEFWLPLTLHSSHLADHRRLSTDIAAMAREQLGTQRPTTATMHPASAPGGGRGSETEAQTPPLVGT
jgi:IstB-like ATP binding protein